MYNIYLLYMIILKKNRVLLVALEKLLNQIGY